jgi:hypothetical protein
VDHKVEMLVPVLVQELAAAAVLVPVLVPGLVLE